MYIGLPPGAPAGGGGRGPAPAAPPQPPTAVPPLITVDCGVTTDDEVAGEAIFLFPNCLISQQASTGALYS